jgi:hypothetical protein
LLLTPHTWAVGSISNGSIDETLIMHWDGVTWTQVPSPSPGTSVGLTGATGPAAQTVLRGTAQGA